MVGRPKKLALPAGQRFQGLFGLPDVIGWDPRRPGRPAEKPKRDDANPDSHQLAARKCIDAAAPILAACSLFRHFRKDALVVGMLSV